MSGPTAPPATGARATRKVRHHAARSGLGTVRHVSAATPNAPAWAVTVVVVLVFSVGPALVGNAGPAAISYLLPSFAAIAAVILWFLGSEKLVVLDHGILVGSFAPFLRPVAIPFAALDVRTVRAAVASARTLGLLVTDRGVSTSSRTVLWSRRAVTFVAVAPTVLRQAAARGLPVDLATATAVDLWVFSARDPRRQEQAVRALGDAARAAGAPGSEQVEALALPARPVQVSPQGADRLAVPERLRSARTRHPQTTR
ncbi:hypothetical protein [Cellulosimicrobium cellulans]|uniref:Uncharacterized protein n=1 Tax=Cellulosimicrobium cellulans TaxID=1710 RepID=A0A4Y4E423_CELCE|nr:hypothetical protein [Cellulosimicrobium cellulans]GED10280.1 hypothetical protein CCE02nite_22790 [Cellulosimicrobium cellulans]